MKRFKSAIALLLLFAAVAQAQVQVNSKVFDVRKDFGAVGDGVADDTAAIQAALDAAQAEFITVAAASTGSTINRELVPTVYFPLGKYATSSDLTVTDRSVKLEGDNAVLIASSDFTGSYGLAISGVTFIDISGLTLVDYPNGIQAGASPDNVPLGHIRISDSTIVGNEAGTGLYLYNRSATGSFENVQFDNWVNAVDCESVDHVTFDRCRFRLDFFEEEADRPDHDGHILLKTGHLHLVNCVFNPNLSTYSGTKPYAWVYVDDPASETATHSVWCNLTIKDSLFGGEGGGLTPVIWDAAPEDANPSYPRTCQLIRCEIGNSKTAVGTGTWAAALVPLQLPNIVHIHDCMFNRIKIVPISYREGAVAPTPWLSTANSPFYYSVRGNAAGSAYAFGRNPNWIPTDIAIPTLDDGTTYPSVAVCQAGMILQTANTSPTTIVGLQDGSAGDRVTILINDANTTVDFTSTILKGNGGVDWSPGAGDHMTCVYDGTNWYCDVSEN